VQLVGWQVLERWHRRARRDKHLFEFARGKPCADVGEVLARPQLPISPILWQARSEQSVGAEVAAQIADTTEEAGLE
jgi:hypothetical protein